MPTTGFPGPKTTRTATPRRVLLTDVGKMVLNKSLAIDASHSRDPNADRNSQSVHSALSARASGDLPP